MTTNILNPDWRLLVAGSVAEVDPAQMEIYRTLLPAQRVWQAGDLSDWVQGMNLKRWQRKNNMTNSPQNTPMRLVDFAKLVIEALEAANVTYMIGGSLALAAWAEARSTQDVDLIISIPFESIFPLSAELKKRDMLVPGEIILDSLIKSHDAPLNAIHLYTGYKADLFLLRQGDTFRATALARRMLMDLDAPLGKVYVHSPEDLILNKLRYFTLSHQPKHTRDITSIILTTNDLLDIPYIEAWAQELNVMEVWQEILKQLPQ